MDHPRLRGEKANVVVVVSVDLGSPPLTRGKAASSSLKPYSFRITPAYAGKSKSANVRQLVLRDHPRLRGEKDRVKAVHAGTKGSPPLTRGKVFQVAENSSAVRITPAYAGKRLKKSHKIGLQQFAKRPIPLTSQIRQGSKSNPPRPGAHRKHPSQNVQQASSAYNL